MNKKFDNPARYFLATYIASYFFWIISAIVSRQPAGEISFILFLIPGMMAPTFAAIWMIRKDRTGDLWASFKNRIFNLRLIQWPRFLASLLIVPAAILVATAISVVFGGDPAQFQLADGFSFSIGMAPTFLILILTATFEELGWRGYGMESLHSKYSYFKASIIFGVLWACWHLPLFFISGLYQYEIANESILYAINFVLSIIPMAVIINWVYQINKKSITAIILFHLFINLSQEALNITQNTKCIESIVLAIFAVIVVLLNRSMFFDKEN
ncbi:MAG: CPBP family intramembrane metalloprotease [Chloroflexi bacterium]|nr:CPBP family intramembrane metalloprotease [Chloroflexota bacterium]BCY16514.1 CPBP family intramembrane metalloprotease [Leptolinea sp. HRD-7]